MLTAMRKCFASIALVASLAGCGGRIPNNVSPDEYEVYAECLKARFAKKAPSDLCDLYTSSRTLVFDPLKTNGCGNEIHDKAGVPWGLATLLGR
jgi:hypothetical protein